ncbi:MAG: flagellar biosynthesis anti-sigma factor FlgM [Phycisphaerae bacterium]|jgi:anti-sigma28 factor (negative regulator of flagellin synthesis)|nr:flagellar biosynthesis anti-sigma factor FlgM [Phycisphaerae bacterium]MBT5365639.1 flagellar biosynthesis anti-sigma factor FlgM [Phycisphaerae bacterium]MBT6268907.1 flagellar biosynthesis anti-sigma factor FlgM [Phycisphaerae bacterium]MBT6281965.1 flagellar biosynthesis anti-sigma factor FlgM [Phycisphaerae bacterium]
MSEISAIGNAGNAIVGSVQPTTPTTPTTTAVEVSAPAMDSGAAGTVDRVEFSEQAQMLEKIHNLPEIRQELVDRVKDSIANNTYLTDVKIDIAIETLINEVAG